MVENELETLKSSIINLDFEGAEKAAKDSMDEGIPAIKVIEFLRSALDDVGEKFENGEYFLSELVVTGEIAKDVMKIIEPYLRKENPESRGKVVLATVFGDIHGIGKNIVNILLKAAGYDVIDLGVSVSREDIVEAVRINKPHILGLSALLTITMVEMEEIIKCLKEVGLREKLKIILGGSPVTKEYADKIGADHKAVDAIDGINKCRQWMEEIR